MKLGLYIQVPFCQTKCTYCNFRTGLFSPAVAEPYVKAVCREIRDCAALYREAGLAVHAAIAGAAGETAYLGGGTPSLLEPQAMAAILDALGEAFGGDWREVTLEADPETVTREKAVAWRAAGIGRISLGVQSFHDVELKAAGRMHRRDEIYTAVRLLRDAGFANLSFDLIAGLAHQTPLSWESSLDQLLALRPEHVSIYLLEVDDGSRLGRELLARGGRYGAAAVPGEDQMVASYERAGARLAAAGYRHYEISNWARPGFDSLHNRKYWRRQPYLGFGAGAHSFDGRERWANAHDPAAYVAAIDEGRLPVEQRERLSPEQALEEELFLGLRQLEGIDYARLEQQYGVRLGPRLERLSAAGLLVVEGTRARLAPERLAVSNEVFVELMA